MDQLSDESLLKAWEDVLSEMSRRPYKTVKVVHDESRDYTYKNWNQISKEAANLFVELGGDYYRDLVSGPYRDGGNNGFKDHLSGPNRDGGDVAWEYYCIDETKIKQSDPIFIQVVSTLGPFASANTAFANKWAVYNVEVPIGHEVSFPWKSRPIACPVKSVPVKAGSPADGAAGSAK
jgi:hypothetical protein